MTINCFVPPCNLSPLQSSTIPIGTPMIPPVLSNGSNVPIYTTLPDMYPSPSQPIFSTSTEELDRFRLLALIIGIAIGAVFLSR